MCNGVGGVPIEEAKEFDERLSDKGSEEESSCDTCGETLQYAEPKNGTCSNCNGPYYDLSTYSIPRRIS
jgi:hypothetical protein